MAEIDRQVWRREGQRLGRISQASPWWIGDWLAFGAEKWGATERWGDHYSEAKRLTGYDAKTLRNRCYVSRAVPKDVRMAGLSWSHHFLVAGMTDRTEQREWLERARAEKFSVDDMRLELRVAERGGYQKRQTSDLEMDAVVTCPKCGSEVLIPNLARRGKHGDAEERSEDAGSS
jgi:hypothetical protein